MTNDDYESKIDPAIDLGADDTLSVFETDGDRDPWVDNHDAARRHTGRDRRVAARVVDELGDLMANGHGFMVRSFSRVTELTTRCRYCGGPLPLPENDTTCEFPGLSWEGCECSGCVTRTEHLIRPQGGQLELCNKPECQRARKRDEMRRYRARQRAGTVRKPVEYFGPITYSRKVPDAAA